MKLWGGRFDGETDESAARFLHSFRFDIRLAAHDIRGSIAHARMLGRQGIVTQEECGKIVEGLEIILAEVTEGNATFDPASEDIHSAVETRLGEIIGETAGRLHTARSRNDQVVTDLRMWLRDASKEIDGAMAVLQSALIRQAEIHAGTVMPGFTHLQPAQPVTLAHHLLAYFWMLERDRGRLNDAAARMNRCPLGAGALAGTGFPIDREFTSLELGFDSPTENSMDSVADRDFVIEWMAFAALCSVHLSRLAQEITLWAAPQFGFVTLDDAYSTGSSIMPQKKNPDVAELCRGKSGRILGHLTGTLAVLKGLPLAYNSDLQEDKEALFDTVDTLRECLEVFAGMMDTARFHPIRMEISAGRGFVTATDIADSLARGGLPFRTAHEIVGRMVAYCEREEKGLEDLTVEEMKAIWPDIPAGFRVVTPAESAALRDSPGGTSPERIREQLSAAKRAIRERSTAGDGEA